MLHRHRLALALANAALLAVATSPFVYFYNVLASAIIDLMSPTELKPLTEAIGDVLRSITDNTSTQWVSMATDKQSAVDATVTPLESEIDAG